MAFSIVKKPKMADPASFSPKYLLHAHLINEREARSYSKVHASDLMSSRDEFCPREYALGLKYKNPRRSEKIATAQQVVFDYGYAVEDLIRNWFADMGRAVGDWECRACGTMAFGQRRPTKCKCGSKGFEYREITFKSTKSAVTCRPDLLLDFGRPKLTLIETKSLDKEEFKKLVAPIAEHRWRTNLYMRIVSESDHPLADKIDTADAYVIYLTKGGYGYQDEQLRRWKLLDGDFSPFKEFEVKRDDSQTDELLERATLIQHYKKTGEVPLGICPTSLVKRAKYCRQSEHCWSAKEMPS